MNHGCGIVSVLMLSKDCPASERKKYAERNADNRLQERESWMEESCLWNDP